MILWLIRGAFLYIVLLFLILFDFFSCFLGIVSDLSHHALVNIMQGCLKNFLNINFIF